MPRLVPFELGASSRPPRYAAVALFGLAVELVRQRIHREEKAERELPFAIVVARPGGAVQGEASLLGNTRLTEVSPEAGALGIRPGQTLAAAKARRSTLLVRVVDEATIRAALVGIAERALAFGATTSFEAGGDAGDTVWVDMTGCAHLHALPGDDEAEAERRLGEALVTAITTMGHACRVAIADGPKVAAAVARFGRREEGRVTVVPPCGNARALGRLPLAALALPDDAHAWLSKLGTRKVSDLQLLPRGALATRLGPHAARVMTLLAGDDRAPLRPHVPPVRPLERLVLDYGIAHHEALCFVLKRLCDRLAARLEGRGKKAAKLLLRLEVDHAVSGAPGKDPALPLTLASPLARAEDLLAVVRAKVESPDGIARVAIERQEDGTMDVPILAVSLEVTEEVRVEPHATDLFVAEARAERGLPRLVAELSAELGARAVGVLALHDTWVAEDRSRLVPYRTSTTSQGPALVSLGDEMTRLLPTPKAVSRGEIRGSRLVSRREQAEWWRGGGKAYDDLVLLWDEGGGRATAWVTVDVQTGEALLRGWVD